MDEITRVDGSTIETEIEKGENCSLSDTLYSPFHRLPCFDGSIMEKGGGEGRGR